MHLCVSHCISCTQKRTALTVKEKCPDSKNRCTYAQQCGSQSILAEKNKSEVEGPYEWFYETWTSSRACLHTSCTQTFSMASWTGWPKRPFLEVCVAEGVTMRYVCAMDSPAFCCAPHLNMYASAIPVGASSPQYSVQQ